MMQFPIPDDLPRLFPVSVLSHGFQLLMGEHFELLQDSVPVQTQRGGEASSDTQERRAEPVRALSSRDHSQSQ